jgi:hypothetical protein
MFTEATTSFFPSGDAATPEAYQLTGFPFPSCACGSGMLRESSRTSVFCAVSILSAWIAPSSVATSTRSGATYAMPELSVSGAANWTFASVGSLPLPIALRSTRRTT